LSTTTPRVDNPASPPEPATEADALLSSITPELFRKFQRLIHRETGIWLGDAKVALLCGRLSRRLRALGIPTLDRYYRFVIEPGQQEERISMVDAITTNETRFFREPKQFEFLEQRAVPRWKADAEQGLRPKTLHLWSAACSSGEEPYSLAMLSAMHLAGEQGWQTSILATDISARMLERARLGIYKIEKSAEIPAPVLKTCMLRGIGEHQGEMKVMPEIQRMVEIRKLNLTQDDYPGEGSFDAILCRNVLIYFDLTTKEKVVERLTRCLRPRGLLLLGQAENLSGVNSQLCAVAPAVYIRVGEQNAF
jgi:chemotaxis protein methyltransferase CheR